MLDMALDTFMHGKFLLSVHLSTQPRWTTLNIIGSDGEVFFLNCLSETTIV